MITSMTPTKSEVKSKNLLSPSDYEFSHVAHLSMEATHKSIFLATHLRKAFTLNTILDPTSLGATENMTNFHHLIWVIMTTLHPVL